MDPDCRLTAKLLIFGGVHFAHATFGLACDFVMAQRLADHEENVLQVDSRCNAKKRYKKLGLL